MMRPAFPKISVALSLFLFRAVWPGIALAQTRERVAPSPAATGQAQSRSPRPAVAPSASPSPPEDPQTVALRQSVATSVSKVLERIQDEEAQLYRKLSYFQKPERLDPNSYASVDEVQDWQKLLQQLHDKGDLVASLYANAGKNLDAELTNARVNARIAQRVRQMVLDGFPWDIIQKKNRLFQQYVDAHGKLLAFYEKNWGTWNAGQPLEFKTAQLTSAYQKIKDQIVSAGKELDQQYKAMAE
jgi:hypothetical protein